MGLSIKDNEEDCELFSPPSVDYIFWISVSGLTLPWVY